MVEIRKSRAVRKWRVRFHPGVSERIRVPLRPLAWSEIESARFRLARRGLIEGTHFAVEARQAGCWNPIMFAGET